MKDPGKPVVLKLQHIVKSFEDNLVLKGIDLEVGEGEFVTLLGSSGCGKTTTLRIIAGLDFPDSGEVILDGQSMGTCAPEKRNVNTVFQNYALFPHMDVFHNIAYGLKIKKAGREKIQEEVHRMLDLVQLPGYEKRFPSEMSGGQKQRVAIARALINQPKVLLLDEPLGALDLQLRRQMQYELKNLQKKLGTTFIYITHDQEEAINMSDVIAVMHDGRFEQIGSPSEIYDYPKTSYVADFVGSANVLSGSVAEVRDGMAVIRHSCGSMLCKTDHFRVRAGEQRTIAVRSENVSVWSEPRSEFHLDGTVVEKSFAGGMLRIVVRLSDGTEIVITRQGMNFPYQVGDDVCLDWEAAKAVFVDMEESSLQEEGN